MEINLLQQLGVALGLGLLVGFQREWGLPHVAGIRSFAMIPPLGVLCAHLSLHFGAWITAAGFIALALVLVTGGLIKFRAGEITPGITTNVAALMMYAVGAMLALDKMLIGVVMGGCVAVLLQWKEPMHAFVQRMGETEVKSIIQLVLFALVILPILPNKTYGPYDVFNPFHAWLMVVLIVGISVAGFMTYKLFGARAGTLLNGLLGGVISSTATTVGYAQRTSKNPAMGKTAAVIIMIASTVVFIRVSFEVLVVGPEVLPHLAPLLIVMVLFMGAICAVLYLTAIESDSISIPTKNPSNLKAAIVFGVLYVAVLFAVAAAKKHFSESGLYLVAALSGLTEMDAITLSATNLIKSGNLSMDTGCRMILVGALSNILFKGGIVALLGSKSLFKRISTAFALSIACGGALVIFWPKIG
ncbi:MAG: MgtC/SapB family protein [Desulfobacterales bacterium]|nr:MgtC/SapB family protein [Desulfobacterales bacterium]